jgi:3alpha(or 20beta)-hydroxysteroid dehydrogenase
MGRLDGKVALISGGARGQGADEAALFAAEGATVVIGDILDDLGAVTATAIADATYVHLDVRVEADWEAVVGGMIERHGRLDIVVNNAAVDMEKALVDTTLEEWNRVISVNQTGVFLGTRTAARAMIAAGNGGSIINISSVAGLEALKLHSAYGATKWAMRGLTRTAAQELGKFGIRVNTVHPGIIETDFTADLKSFTDPALRAKFERGIALRRYGRTDDVAKLVLFLASDDAGYCTGQEYLVDGGIHR